MSAIRAKLLVKPGSTADRAAGAIMGGLIGDALGCGCHWYYDVSLMHSRYGAVRGYVKPADDWYHSGMKPGQLSQTGIMMKLMLESVAEKNGYDHEDYCKRFDGLLDACDGTPHGGPGGYTDQNVREVWNARKVRGLPWGAEGVAAWTDTAEGAHRSIVLGARYAKNGASMTRSIIANNRMTYADPYVISQSAAYSALVGLLVSGVKFDTTVAAALRKLDWKNAVADEDNPLYVPNVDALLQPGFIARAAQMKKEINIAPEHVAQMYGLSCQITCLLPAAYFLAARHGQDFGTAVFGAINGGGNNMARAALTGGLVGAQVGLSGIPAALIEGLEDGARLSELAQRVALAAENDDGSVVKIPAPVAVVGPAEGGACARRSKNANSQADGPSAPEDCGCPTGV